jgi:hypothetical protein
MNYERPHATLVGEGATAGPGRALAGQSPPPRPGLRRRPLIRDRKTLGHRLPVVPLGTHVIEYGLQIGEREPGLCQRCEHSQLRVIAWCVLWRCIALSNGRVHAMQLGRLDMPFAVVVFSAGDVAGFDYSQDGGFIQAGCCCGWRECVGHGALRTVAGERCVPRCAAMINDQLRVAWNFLIDTRRVRPRAAYCGSSPRQPTADREKPDQFVTGRLLPRVEHLLNDLRVRPSRRSARAASSWRPLSATPQIDVVFVF